MDLYREGRVFTT
uniref:Uncharacterized protein n=1 Tax=Anguilla anguilla TaxID=7936 RepID=A0A0E9QRW5_ANGAN